MSANPSTLPPNIPPDDSRGYVIITVHTIFFVIALGIVILRLYVRKFILRALWWDDLFMVIALLVAFLLYIFSILAFQDGQGRHVYYLSLAQVEQTTKWLTIAEPFTAVGTAFSRASIALFLMRLLVIERKWFIFFRCLLVFIAVNYIAIFVQDYFQCSPYEAKWTITENGPDGTCWPDDVLDGLGYYTCALAIGLDLALAALPTVFLWDLRISARRKFGICCLMGLGLITAGAAIGRTYQTMLFNRGSTDPTWDTVDLVIWSFMEELLIIINGSIPAIQPIFKARRRRKSNYYITDHSERTTAKRRLKRGHGDHTLDTVEDGLTSSKTQASMSQTLRTVSTGSKEQPFPNQMELGQLNRSMEDPWQQMRTHSDALDMGK